jgi:hypothetical protein
LKGVSVAEKILYQIWLDKKKIAEFNNEKKAEQAYDLYKTEGKDVRMFEMGYEGLDKDFMPDGFSLDGFIKDTFI